MNRFKIKQLVNSPQPLHLSDSLAYNKDFCGFTEIFEIYAIYVRSSQLYLTEILCNMDPNVTPTMYGLLNSPTEDSTVYL